MVQFSYSFCMAMLHSLWQAALIVLLYKLIERTARKRVTPLARRNFLYYALFVQVILMPITFAFYYFNYRSIGVLTDYLDELGITAGSTQLQNITTWVFVFYLAVVAFKFIRSTGSWIGFKSRYKAGLQKPDAELKIFTTLKARHLGISRQVTLWLSHSIQTPVTFGFLKPVILLPVSLVNNISTRQVEALILHELTHIRTNDYLLNWFLLVSETLFFFNPFVTSLCKRIRLEREKNCDLNVINFAYSPVMYAETLLQAEKVKRMVPAYQLAAVSQKDQLLQRIKFFTAEEVKADNNSGRKRMLLGVAALILLAVFSVSILFHTGRSAYPAGSFAEFHALPFSNYMVSDAKINKPINTEPVLSTEPISENKNSTAKSAKQFTSETIAAEVNENNPVPEPVSPTTPVLQSTAFANVIPVATKENDAARQIIIKEETAEGATLKVYYLSFEDGSWILQPEWIIRARELQTDSLKNIKTDSLRIKIRPTYPAQQ